jgi:membrane protein DedA with SNARE-associated domain
VSGLGAAISQHGGWLVLLNVFCQQIGVPLPAEPTLVVAGSFVARGRLAIVSIAAATLVATLVADLIWFVIGRRYGGRALGLVLRLSSTPHKHLTRIERLFARWGPAAFAIVKFIPGLPMTGPVLAGSFGTTLPTFFACDLLATSLWASAFIGLGIAFERDVEFLQTALDRVGGWALLAGAALVVGVTLRRWYKSRVTLSPPRASGVISSA